jgi:signal transduction histidine kinase
MNYNPKDLQKYQELVEISCELASTLDLDKLLRRIVEAASRLCNAEASSILLYHDDRKELRFQAASNSENLAMLRSIVVPEESVAGWVAKNQEAIIISNVENDPRHFNKVGKSIKLPTHSMIAVPMIAQNTLIGVLEVINKLDGDFDTEDLDTLNVLGAQAAIAIANTRLFQQSDLIAELIHELRTPLASMNTITYLLQRPEISSEQRVDLAQTIHYETQRLNDMVTSFLDLSRLESGRTIFSLGTFNAQNLLLECVNLVRPQANQNQLTIETEFEDNLPELFADRDKLKQVFLNLLSNAIKYNRPQGKIIIKAWQIPEEEQFYVSFTDTGIGISEVEMPRLFQKFFRSQNISRTAPGTGLGLSICKHIIDSHNGKIEVESEFNIGTTFKVSLPITQKR